MGIMQSLRKKDRRPEDVATLPKPSEAPPLMMLIPDAQGIATYQLHKFPSARAAEIFVDATLRGQINEGAVLFWALNWQPSAGSYAEPIVLIRDVDRPLVYLFSFADLNSCHDFVRHEMTRGLELEQVMIYWAHPAAVEVDFWGRAAVTPSAVPQRPVTAEPEASPEEPPAAEPEATATVLSFTARDEGNAAGEPRYLTETDIAETIRQMNELASQPRDAAPVIDFPSALKKLSQSKAAKANARAWANFALALDEALDAHVAEQVRLRLGLNRIVRALAEAAYVKQRLAKEDAAEATAASSSNRRAWQNASIALADAATVVVRRKLMQRVWMNTAWTLEEAAYAHRLEKKARAIRGWRFASVACAEAVDAHTALAARKQILATAWSAAGQQIAEAAVAHQRHVRVRTGLAFAFLAVEEAVEAKAYRDEINGAWAVLSIEFAHAAEAYVARQRAVSAWNNAAMAFGAAGKVYAKQQKLMIHVWSRIARAIKQALAAEAKQRKAEEKSAKTAATAVVNSSSEPEAPDSIEDTTSDEEKIADWVAKQQAADPAPNKRARHNETKRWEPREEPFEGFRSPPGRF
jgi:hypothetical protein